jgi:hypothetical protein
MPRPQQVHFTGDQPDRFEKQQPPFNQGFDKHYGSSIHNLIQDTVKDENFIGQGAGAKVYRIPKLPNFVLRIWHGTDISRLPARMEQTNWDILPIHVGQPIASFQPSDIEITRYQSGKTTKLSLSSLFKNYNFKELFAEGEQKPLKEAEIAHKRPLYTEHLKYTAAMPQEAYDDLAHKIEVLNGYSNLHFDPNIRNILANKDKKTFNIVDLTSTYGLGPHKNVSGMAGALIDCLFINLDGNAIGKNGEKSLANVAEDASLILLRRAVLEKTFLAAYRTGLRMPGEDWPEIPLGNQRGIGKRRYYMDANYICRVSGFDWQKVKALLQASKNESIPESRFLQLLKTCEQPT